MNKRNPRGYNSVFLNVMWVIFTETRETCEEGRLEKREVERQIFLRWLLFMWFFYGEMQNLSEIHVIANTKPANDH